MRDTLIWIVGIICGGVLIEALAATFRLYRARTRPFLSGNTGLLIRQVLRGAYYHFGLWLALCLMAALLGDYGSPLYFICFLNLVFFSILSLLWLLPWTIVRFRQRGLTAFFVGLGCFLSIFSLNVMLFMAASYLPGGL